MSPARNGTPSSNGESTRRLRFDDLAIVSGSHPVAVDRGHSGRRFVLVAGAVFLVGWGVLFLIFQEWKTRYRRRAAYGATHVVSVIDRLRATVPPDIDDPKVWCEAVEETRAMVQTVVGSNLLGIDEMDRLRAELVEHAERATAHPASARMSWLRSGTRLPICAEFLFQDSRSPRSDRHPRPKILPPRPQRGSSSTAEQGKNEQRIRAEAYQPQRSELTRKKTHRRAANPCRRRLTSPQNAEKTPRKRIAPQSARATRTKKSHEYKNI